MNKVKNNLVSFSKITDIIVKYTFAEMNVEQVILIKMILINTLEGKCLQKGCKNNK